MQLWRCYWVSSWSTCSKTSLQRLWQLQLFSFLPLPPLQRLGSMPGLSASGQNLLRVLELHVLNWPRADCRQPHIICAFFFSLRSLSASFLCFLFSLSFLPVNSAHGWTHIWTAFWIVWTVPFKRNTETPPKYPETSGYKKLLVPHLLHQDWRLAISFCFSSSFFNLWWGTMVGLLLQEQIFQNNPKHDDHPSSTPSTKWNQDALPFVFACVLQVLQGSVPPFLCSGFLPFHSSPIWLPLWSRPGSQLPFLNGEHCKIGKGILRSEHLQNKIIVLRQSIPNPHQKNLTIKDVGWHSLDKHSSLCACSLYMWICVGSSVLNKQESSALDAILWIWWVVCGLPAFLIAERTVSRFHPWSMISLFSVKRPSQKVWSVNICSNQVAKAHHFVDLKDADGLTLWSFACEKYDLSKIRNNHGADRIVSICKTCRVALQDQEIWVEQQFWPSWLHTWQVGWASSKAGAQCLVDQQRI